MADTITLSKQQFKTLTDHIRMLEEKIDELTKIVKKTSRTEPKYGSDEWWEWSDKRAVQDIKAGRYTTIKNKKELEEFFKKL